MPTACRGLMTSQVWTLSRCRAGFVRFSAKENLDNRQRYRLDITTEGERDRVTPSTETVSPTRCGLKGDRMCFKRSQFFSFQFFF